MLKGTTFKSTAGKVDKIHTRFFQLNAELLSIIWACASGLELHRIELYANNELRVCNSSLYFFDDFEDDTTSIVQIATVLVGALIRCLGEKLCKQVTMSAMDLFHVNATIFLRWWNNNLHPVISSLIT